MNTEQHASGRNVGAIIAALIAAALVGALALMLMDRDGAANTRVSAEPQFSEPSLPQAARYPEVNEKFAPDRLIQVEDLEPATAYPAPCQGEGLLDGDIRAGLDGQGIQVDRFCAPGARLANASDAGPGEGYPPPCRDGKLIPELYAHLSDEAILLLGDQCASNALDSEPLFPTGEGHVDPTNAY